MRTKKGGLFSGMLKNMTNRLPRMSRSRRVLPSSMLPTGIIEEIAQELPRQSRRKTPAQREARARTRASRSKVPSPDAQRIVREIAQLRANIDNYSKQAETLKAQSDANAAAVMETVEEAKAELDRIEGKQGKNGGKRSRSRKYRKSKRTKK